ncbi:isopenicillin N synthase family oxygenase [Paraburkholderia sp. LEh10]|uniref:isopenicillin N synthase family dioxygenase n=1 Tax=Paraburkholderia sp. LEh10 TaxID=2821353 RepID=UPI001AE401FF|nr:isopenicillin N synthase family oxygenase [Paraburkholderia sp. LEh10]MBP0588566.1 isopenicillin N synthase family oxygenase [Paraburkholderia sp. LEh10]
MNIPLIDVAPLFSDDPRGWSEVERALYDAHSTIGFSVLVNHRVPRSVTDDLFCASRRFHALPDERKMPLRYGANLRGFLPLNTSTLRRSPLGSAKKPNHSDSFIVIDELDESLRERWSHCALSGHQIWPREVDGFEAAARRYRDAVARLGMKVLPCFSEMMGLPRDGLNGYYTPNNPILRLLHYPALPMREPDVFGSAPHTDYGCLTFVAQDEVGGLQVQAADGDWLDVPFIDNSLVLNTGQIIATWSRGRIKATPHRVVNHPCKARYSIAFFFDCGLNAPVAPLVPPQDSTAAREAQPTKLYGEHLEALLRANYSFSA